MRFEDFIKKTMKNTRLGGGGEKDVFIHPTKQDRVIGVYRDEIYPEESEFNELATERYSAEKLKQIFYATKVARMLFPKNVAAVHWVAGNPPSIEKDKIEGKPLGDVDLYSDELHDLCVEMQSAGLRIDSPEDNFLRNKEGNFVFIDDIYIEQDQKSLARFNSTGIKAAIRESNLPEEEQERALRYVERATTTSQLV